MAQCLSQTAPPWISMRIIEAKVVVVGSQAVGKTSVVVGYTSGVFHRTANPTVGASFFTCNKMVDNCQVRLQIWDTAGQERFKAMAPLYYRGANAALLMFDITAPKTFEDLEDWVKELQKHTDGNMVLCLVGNKCDLESYRRISSETAVMYAASIGATYFETSAKSNEGVEEVFSHMARSLLTAIDLESYDLLTDAKVISPKRSDLLATVDLSSSNAYDSRTKRFTDDHSCCKI